jgi:hypothetical protein
MTQKDRTISSLMQKLIAFLSVGTFISNFPSPSHHHQRKEHKENEQNPSIPENNAIAYNPSIKQISYP